MTNKKLVLDAAKTLKPGFLIRDVLAIVQKPGTDPKTKLRNAELKEVAWGLVGDGKIKSDGNGGLVVA